MKAVLNYTNILSLIQYIAHFTGASYTFTKRREFSKSLKTFILEQFKKDAFNVIYKLSLIYLSASLTSTTPTYQKQTNFVNHKKLLNSNDKKCIKIVI